MKLEDIVFKPIGLGEPPYKFVEIRIDNPQSNITGLFYIGNKLYYKEYV